MKISIAKWGNSAGVRIPASVMAAAKLSLGSQAEMSVEEGKIIIRPVAPHYEYSLEELVSAITPENNHGEISTGSPVGKELL